MTTENIDTATPDTNEVEVVSNRPQHSPILYKFTNQESSPYMDNILAMFYDGAYNNRIGIMEAHNLETETEEMILVGVELDENGKPICFPLCKVLRAEDVTKYLSPDGDGGFFDMLNQQESEAAREKMRPIDQAVIDGDE